METSLDRLKEMVNKPFIYKNKEVTIINFCDGTGDDGDEVEIYLNNGQTIEVNYALLSAKLNQFKPITDTMIVLADERINSVSTFNPTIMCSLRDIILEQISEVRQDPNAVQKAKSVYDGVNALTNLCKTELEYRKYLDNKNNNGK